MPKNKYCGTPIEIGCYKNWIVFLTATSITILDIGSKIKTAMKNTATMNLLVFNQFNQRADILLIRDNKVLSLSEESLANTKNLC